MSDDTDLRKAWNVITPYYQEHSSIPTDFAHYGPHCPNEDQLQLVGDVRAKRVLEIGCGGGQCAIAFAKRGATATGIDLSDAQIEFARALAEREGVEVAFRQGNIEDLSAIADASQDVVFSAYALVYVGRLDACFAEVARVLKPGGLFVFSVNHPFWHCLSQDMRVESPYNQRLPVEWNWEYEGTPLCERVRAYRHTVGDWFRLLRRAGLEVVDILEPEPVEFGSGQDWNGLASAERQRIVPMTIIWKARKPE